MNKSEAKAKWESSRELYDNFSDAINLQREALKSAEAFREQLQRQMLDDQSAYIDQCNEDLNNA